MYIPKHVQEAIKGPVTATATATETVTATVVIPVRHHDVGSQLGEHSNNEFYGYEEPIELKGSRSVF